MSANAEKTDVPFNTEVIIDADLTSTGWEIAVRLDASSMEAAWADITDLEGIAKAIGEVVVSAVLSDYAQTVSNDSW